MIAYPNVKLNLGLHVLRRREDGYHDLDTLFIPYLGFHDTLEIITGDDSAARRPISRRRTPGRNSRKASRPKES